MKIFLTLFAAVFMLIGLFTSYTAAKAFIEQHNAKDWKVTTGKITVVKFYDSMDAAGTTSYSYQYRYEVNNQIYTGDREHFGLGISTDEHPVTFHEGHIVNVYYDPASPDKAVLRPDVSGIITFTLIVGGVFLLVGTWLMVTALRGKAFD